MDSLKAFKYIFGTLGLAVLMFVNISIGSSDMEANNETISIQSDISTPNAAAYVKEDGWAQVSCGPDKRDFCGGSGEYECCK